MSHSALLPFWTRGTAALLISAGLSAPAWSADGAALFTQHCAACHQADASGTVGLAPTLKGEHWQKLGADRSFLPTVLLHGLSGAIQVGSQRFVGSMPSFAQSLNDEQVAAVATHLRSMQGADASAPYSAEEIATQRKQAGSPPQTRQWRQKLLGQ